MEWFSGKNLRRLISLIHGDMTAFLSSVADTFQEVYDNMDALDEKITGVTYSSETETVVTPESIGSYDSGTETIILK